MQTLNLPNAKQLKKLKFWRTSTFITFLFGYISYYLVRKNQAFANIYIIKDFPAIHLEDLALIGLFGEIFYAVGKLINGPLADKLGGKKLFLGGMLAAVLLNFLYTLGSTVLYFTVIWSVARFFLSAGWGGLTKVIGSWYEERSVGKSMGIISTSFMFGSAISSGISYFISLYIESGETFFIFGKLTWRHLFILPALFVSVYFLVTLFLSKEHPREVYENVKFGNYGEEAALQDGQQDSLTTDESLFSIALKLLKFSYFRWILLFSILTSIIRISFFYWVPMFLYLLGLRGSTSILSALLFPTFGALGTIFLGWYTDKYAKDKDRAKMTYLMLIPLLVILFTLPMLGVKKASVPLEKANISKQSVKSSVSIIEELEAKPKLIAVILLFGLAGFFLMGPYAMSSGAFTIDSVGPKYAGSATGLIDFAGYIAAAPFANIVLIKIAKLWSLNAVYIFLGVITFLAVLCARTMSGKIRRKEW